MPSDSLELEAATRFRNFNWEKARTFYMIAKMGSYSKASVFLRISQSALSRQILDLEKSLDARLFIRESRGVKLTRKGEDLYSIVETTFQGLKEFTRNTHAETKDGNKRKIRIAATHADAAYILNDLLLDYNEQHPELIFELVSDDHMIDIVLNDVDIAIRPFDSKARGVQQELLFTLEKKLFASQSYIDKYGEPQKVEDLRDHHILSFARPEELPYADVSWVLSLGMSYGKLKEPVYTSTSIECLVKAAKRGHGILASYEKMTIIKEANLRNILPNIRYKEEDGYFIYPDHLGKDENILNIKEFLKKSLT